MMAKLTFITNVNQIRSFLNRLYETFPNNGSYFLVKSKMLRLEDNFFNAKACSMWTILEFFYYITYSPPQHEYNVYKNERKAKKKN